MYKPGVGVEKYFDDSFTISFEVYHFILIMNQLIFWVFFLKKKKRTMKTLKSPFHKKNKKEKRRRKGLH